jgi:putative PEP-CTERM system TPR-repeat lipoprotein
MLALAELQARTGAGAGAVAELLSKAVQVHPTEPGPRIALINVYLANSEHKKAMAAAQDAAAAIPDRIEILDALARSQQAAGDSNQALATYAKLAGLVPNSPELHVRVAEIHAGAKNREAALQSLRKALDVTPNYLPAQRAMILLYLDANQVQEARAIAREISKQRPNEPIGVILEGDIASMRQAWGDAAAAYRAAFKQSASTDVAIKLHRVLQADGKAAEADKVAANWFIDHPRDMGMHAYLAESALARNDPSDAAKHYLVIAQTQPNNHLALNNLAWALGQAKDPRAVEYAEKANRLAPNQPAVMDTLASLLAEKGDTARAIELLQKAVELAPQMAPVRLSLARVLMKAGKAAEARKHLDELAKLGDKFPGQAEVARLLKQAGG